MKYILYISIFIIFHGDIDVLPCAQMISQTTNAKINHVIVTHQPISFTCFNRTTGEAGFLAKGWSRIAMQWCSSALILFTFLLPASPASSLLPFLSHVDAARAAWGETKKRGSSVLFWGSCAASPSPLSPIPSHLFWAPLQFYLYALFHAVPHQLTSFHLHAFFELRSRSQAYTLSVLVELPWPEFSFISEINCFSIKPPSDNRSSCTVCCWSKLRPLLNWFCRSCWNIWFSRSEGFNKTEFCDYDSWTLSP